MPASGGKPNLDIGSVGSAVRRCTTPLRARPATLSAALFVKPVWPMALAAATPTLLTFVLAPAIF
jgi:hypothetical protein